MRKFRSARRRNPEALGDYLAGSLVLGTLAFISVCGMVILFVLAQKPY